MTTTTETPTTITACATMKPSAKRPRRPSVDLPSLLDALSDAYLPARLQDALDDAQCAETVDSVADFAANLKGLQAALASVQEDLARLLVLAGENT